MAAVTATESPETSKRWLGWGATLIVPAVVSVSIFRFAGRIGFSATDDGYLASQSWRLLLGQVPHRDFISPRPALSALFHLPELVLPGPLFFYTRFVPIVELVAYTTLFTWILTRRSPARWGPVLWAVNTIAVLVNLHAFLLSSWYTIDGLLLISAGVVLVLEVPTPRRRMVGFLLLGMAPLCKQSFFAAPLIGLVLAWVTATPGPSRRQRVVIAAGLMAAPSTLYLCWIAAVGGLGPMLHQFSSASPVFGARWTEISSIRSEIVSLAVLGALLVGAILLVRLPLRQPALALAATGAAVAALAALLRATLQSGLEYGGWWAVRLVWLLVAAAVAAWAVGRPRPQVLVVVASAWMVTLSWGYDFPNLVGGTLLVGCAVVAMPAALPRPRVLQACAVAAAAVALYATVDAFVETRRFHVYMDRAEPELTADLGNASPEFYAIRTSPAMAEYMEAVERCVEQYPADEVAVLPDNPGLYAPLRFENPFPIDWMLPSDFRGSEDLIISSAQRNPGRSRLVLFQRFSNFDMGYHDAPLEAPAPGELPFTYGTGIERRLYEALAGERITCGPFLAVYDK